MNQNTDGYIQYVCGFLFDNSRNNIVLIKKQKPEWQKNKFNGIGGKIEPGEDIYSAMKREFLEEAGVTVDKWEIMLTIVNDESKYVLHFFKAFNTELFNNVATMESEVVYQFPLRDVMLQDFPKIPNLNWLLPMALDKTIKYGILNDIGN